MGGDDEEVRPGWLPPRAPGSAAPAPSRAPAPARGGRTDPLATASLVAALTGVALLTLSIGALFVVTLPCSALGWLLGRRAEGRIAAERDRGGSGIAHAGAMLGLIGLGLGTLAMIVWGTLILSGFTPDDLRRKLEERRERPPAPTQQAVRDVR